MSSKADEALIAWIAEISDDFKRTKIYDFKHSYQTTFFAPYASIIGDHEDTFKYRAFSAFHKSSLETGLEYTISNMKVIIVPSSINMGIFVDVEISRLQYLEQWDLMHVARFFVEMLNDNSRRFPQETEHEIILLGAGNEFLDTDEKIRDLENATNNIPERSFNHKVSKTSKKTKNSVNVVSISFSIALKE